VQDRAQAQAAAADPLLQTLPEPVPAAKPPAETRAAPVSDVRTEEPPSRIRTDDPERASVTPARKFDMAALPGTQARRALPPPPQVGSSNAPLPRTQSPVVTAPQAAPPRVPLNPAPAPVQTASAKPVYSGPTAGRIIWVGRLERGGRVSIDGGRASSGVLTGELPGVPVSISAHPAELGSGGLRVYTSNPSGARVREAAGPQNGWNATTYDWNPRRLSDVLVTEAPSPQNGWKGLAVRGNGSPVSVIVIDWRVASN
jgi:hypothetical protein